MTSSLWRRFAFGALAAAATSFAAGSASAQTLRMWSFLDPAGKTGREIVLKDLIEKFEAANPGVKVTVEPQVWQQLGEKFLAAHQTGTAPDVVWINIQRIGAAIEAGSLANLDELFLNKWSPQEIADVDGSYFRYKAEPGKHYQYTASRSIFGICYRYDLVKGAGIDPRSLQTWDKFIEAAQKLQQTDANGNVTRWGFAQSFVANGDPANIGMSTIIHLQGEAFHKDGKPNWATPAGVKGLQLYVDMVKKYKITPQQAVSMSSDDVYDQLTAGKAVFARCSSARVPNLAKALAGTGEVNFLPTPSFKPGEWSPTEAGGWPLGVWSKSKNKELAGKLLEFMISKDLDVAWTKVGGQVPGRQSTIDNDPKFFSDPANAYLTNIAEAMKTAGWFPPDYVIAGKNDAYIKAIQDALTNGTEPMAALKKAEEAYIRANRL